MTNIKLDRYDQVSITLLLIIIVVAALDTLSGRLRQWVLEGENESLAGRTRCGTQSSAA
jgi:phosphonate transport system permease protein